MIEQGTGFGFNLLIGGASGAIAKGITTINERITTFGIAHFITHSKEKSSMSFWRENFRSVARYAPFSALSFTLNEQYFGLLRNPAIKSGMPWSVVDNVVAGSAAGVTTLLLEFPFQNARVQLISAAMRRQTLGYKKMAEFCWRTLKAQGITSIYQGFGVALRRVMLYRGVYFGGYNAHRNSVFDTNTNIVAKLIVASLISSLAFLTTYPSEIIEKNLFPFSKAAKEPFKGVVGSFIDMLSPEGIQKLFKRSDFKEVMGRHVVTASLAMVIYSEFHLMVKDRSIEN
jgi:solute carrier family 25 (adenine nucleotide translocator) protein 4/5/6/31